MRAALVAQFKNPHGGLGALVGWIMATRPSNRRRNEWTVAQLLPRAGGRILEIGCGPGYGVASCLKRYPECRVMALDHSALMIAQARLRNSRAVAEGRAEFLHGSLDMLAEREGLAGQAPRFSAAYFCNVLQFFDDKRAAVATIAGLLEPSGVLATTFQPRGASPTRERALRFGDELVADYRAAGLENVALRELSLKPAPAVCVVGRAPADRQPRNCNRPVGVFALTPSDDSRQSR